MGLGMIDYTLHGDRRPSMLVVTDINEARLARARELFTEEDAKNSGVELRFVNTANMENAAEYLREISGGGYDDVFAYAPITPVVEMASDILGRDGCLSFFAGPTDPTFSARLNYYDVHYNSCLLYTSSPWTCCARPALICDQRATGTWLRAFVLHSD